MRNDPPNDNIKTGFLGILVPMIGAAYGIRTIIRQRTSGRWGGEPTYGDEAIEFGLAVIGIAIFSHAWGFEPYRRHPVIRGILTLAGIVLFLKGVIRGI